MELAYRKAWRALNTMLEEGKSYSGFERNCAFLHLGGNEARFADISGACGLDVMDDGRSIAVCDWDYDGKEDFWITNRTAPRVRLQHNRSRTPNDFVAIKLQGVTCNRNAIGARVELTVKGAPGKRIRTVRAGEGFLAQSSSWMHFGLAKGTEIAGLTVRWPGGEKETISGLEGGGFYLITQGAATAKQWTPPVKGNALADLPPAKAPAPVSEAARVVMASPLPFPDATYLDLSGTRKEIAGGGKPLLINLWATWCVPCVAEMEAWKKEEAALRKTGIAVLALSVDDPEEPFAKRSALVQPFLKKRKFPFPAGLADAGILDVLEVAGRAQLDKYESLPVPSSLLLDSRGRIAVIYKGPVEVKQLEKDVALLEAGDAERHAAAAHFPGTWIDGPWPADPSQMIDKFMSFGNPEAARRYLDRFRKSADPDETRDLSESYYLVGSELAFQKNFAEAIVALAHAVRQNPAKSRIRLQLATLMFRMRRFAEAIPHLRAVVQEQPQGHNTRKMLSLALIQSGDHANAVRHLEYLSSLDPNDAMGKLWYGHALVRVGRAAEAEKLIRAALRLQPDSLLVLNELAWLLATHTDPEIYDPEEALPLAVKAAALSQHRNPRVLDTLAASQAANGDFKAAAKTLENAIALAEAARDQGTAKELRGRRALYQSGKAYRQSFAEGKREAGSK